MCRPFHRGRDAVEAIAALGVAAAAIGASRVLVCWEHSDLCAALGVRDTAEDVENGLLVADAGRFEHEIRRHPLRLHLGPVNDDGLPTVLPEWGPISRHAGAPLPEPVALLLAAWRCDQPRPENDVVRMCAAMEQVGYRLRWVSRHVPGLTADVLLPGATFGGFGPRLA